MKPSDTKRLGRAYKALNKAYEDVRKVKPENPLVLQDQARFLEYVSKAIDTLRYGFGFGDTEDEEVDAHGLRRVD